MGGTIFGFYGGGHSCFEGGGIELGKTLVMVDFLNNAVSFVWDFTITMQTKNLTDVSVTKLWSIKQNDKPGNRKNLFYHSVILLTWELSDKICNSRFTGPTSLKPRHVYVPDNYASVNSKRQHPPSPTTPGVLH